MISPATEQKLRLVAAVYRDALRDGSPPTVAVAVELKVSHSQAANLVSKARHWGLLEATTKGRASRLT